MSLPADFSEVLEGSGVFVRQLDAATEVLLARAKQGNSLPSLSLSALNLVLEHAEADTTVTGLVFRAQGASFWGGGVFSDAGSNHISPNYKPAISEFYTRWASRSFPVLSVVQGSAVAFGCSVALTSDIAVVSEKASFHLPELNNGLVPVFAMSLLSTRYESKFIRDLVLTGEPLSAARALALGAVTDLVKPAELEQRVVAHLLRWKTVGSKALRQFMRTSDSFDRAGDAAAVKAIADEGLDELFRRVRDGESTQGYLDADKAAL